MENKIAIGSLAGALSKTTGKTKKLCEDFLKEYFRIVTECLENGETLKIKGFGTFKITEVEARSSVNVNTGERLEIASYKKVVFTPAKELATAINAPFADFSTVEMDDEVPEDVFYEDREESVGNENNVDAERLETGSEEENEDDIITAEAYNILDEKSEKVEKPEKDKKPEGERQQLFLPRIEPKMPKEEPSVTEEEVVESENNVQETSSHEKTETITEKKAAEDLTPVKSNDTYVLENSDMQNQHIEEQNVKFLKSRFDIGFILGALSTFAVCVLIFALGCFFGWWPVNFQQPKQVTVVSQQPVPVDTQIEGQSIQEETETTEQPGEPAVVRTEPKIKPIAQTGEKAETKEEAKTESKVKDKQKPVYDTVSKTRYLTTIARDHYGNYNLWPYIYKENEKILGHPDRITPGTKVVVPDLAKYGVDPNNKDDIKKAKKLGFEIYSKYR